MIRKLAVAGASAALLLATAVPAFASSWSLVNNWADVSNTVNTSANTGWNSINADSNVNGGSITTGFAQSVATVNNTVNSNNLYNFSTGFDFGSLLHNATDVNNKVNTSANTGWNSLNADDHNVNGGSVSSGYAQAGSVVSNVINTNVLHDFGFGFGD